MPNQTGLYTKTEDSSVCESVCFGEEGPSVKYLKLRASHLLAFPQFIKFPSKTFHLSKWGACILSRRLNFKKEQYKISVLASVGLWGCEVCFEDLGAKVPVKPKPLT